MTKEAVLKKRFKLLERSKKLKRRSNMFSTKIIRLMVAGRVPKLTVQEKYGSEWSLIYKNLPQYYPLGVKSFLVKNLKDCNDQSLETDRFHMLHFHTDHIRFILAYHNRKWKGAFSSGAGNGHNRFTEDLLNEFEWCHKEEEKIFGKNWTPLTVKEWEWHSTQMLNKVFNPDQVVQIQDMMRKKREKKRKKKD
jgi:hypothetical protein